MIKSNPPLTLNHNRVEKHMSYLVGGLMVGILMTHELIILTYAILIVLFWFFYIIISKIRSSIKVGTAHSYLSCSIYNNFILHVDLIGRNLTSREKLKPVLQISCILKLKFKNMVKTKRKLKFICFNIVHFREIMSSISNFIRAF